MVLKQTERMRAGTAFQIPEPSDEPPPSKPSLGECDPAAAASSPEGELALGPPVAGWVSAAGVAGAGVCVAAGLSVKYSFSSLPGLK